MCRYEIALPECLASATSRLYLAVSVLLRPFKHLRTKLLVSMLAVVFLLTASVLTLVQARLRGQVRTNLASTLQTQSRVYGEIEKVRREQAQ